MGILGKVRRTVRKIDEWKRLVWDDKTDFQVPFSVKLRYALKGFSVNEYVWYDLANHDCAEYISEFERLRSREINGEYKFILDNKLVFEEIFGQYTFVPKNYALVENGWVHALHGMDVGDENFEEFLLKTGKTILKWLDRGGGTGTYFFENRQGSLYANGEPCTAQQLEKIRCREGRAILCQYITQSEFSASLYPYTTNTIRIVCAREKGEPSARIIAAVQRVGCETTIPVDNAHAGGLTCGIDLATGEISYGIARLGKMERRMKKFHVHPDSQTQIAGKVIPGWEQLKKDIVALTNKVPYLNFVAWDVLLTEEGFCIIEGNASSGCGIFQMEHGVRSSALGDIYRSYGVIE